MAAEGRWECPACEEMNREDRVKCNNCNKPRPGLPVVAAPAAAAVAGDAQATANAAPQEERRKRRRGWNDEEAESKAAARKASSASANMLEKMVNMWQPSVEQLEAMTVAELSPLLKTWKVHVDPKDFSQDLMLAKALQVIHSIGDGGKSAKAKKPEAYTMYNPPPPPAVEIVD